jgi:hypothetical protein
MQRSAAATNWILTPLSITTQSSWWRWPHRRRKPTKLASYFRLASLQHYLIIRPTDEQSFVIHHQRMPNGDILTRIRRDGALKLEPPGIPLQIAALFP